MNLPEAMDWLKVSPERSSVLFGASAETLTEVFGPPVQHWVGGSGRYRHKVWLADADGIPVFVLNSKRGTVYEVAHPEKPWGDGLSPDDRARILALVAEMYLRFEEVAPVQKFGPVVGPDRDPVLAEARCKLDGAEPQVPTRGRAP